MPAIRRGFGAACRPSTSANETEPRASLRPVQTPTLMRWQATAGRTAPPLQVPPAGPSKVRGSARHSVARRPAPGRPLAPRHLPQPFSTRTPFVANPCRAPTERFGTQRPRGNRALIERACQIPVQARGIGRAALNALPRKKSTHSRTQGAFPRRAARPMVEQGTPGRYRVSDTGASTTATFFSRSRAAVDNDCTLRARSAGADAPKRPSPGGRSQ